MAVAEPELAEETEACSERVLRANRARRGIAGRHCRRCAAIDRRGRERIIDGGAEVSSRTRARVAEPWADVCAQGIAFRQRKQSAHADTDLPSAAGRGARGRRGRNRAKIRRRR